MKKRILLTILAALTATAAGAQNPAASKRIPMQILRDLDSTSYEYCALTGQGGVSTAEPREVGIRVTTASGGSTAPTSTTANAYLGMAVGDVLIFSVKGTREERVIVTWTDADNVVLNRAINLHQEITGSSNGVTFAWRQLTCGTTAESGWMNVAGLPVVSFSIDIDQMNVTGNIDVRVECRDLGANLSPQQIFLDAVATAGIPTGRLKRTLNWTPYAQCRVGTKLTTDDGGDLTTNAEQVSIAMQGGDYER